MSKTNEMNLAKIYYVEHGMTGFITAEKVGVSLTHFYRWVRRYGWRELREERLKAYPKRPAKKKNYTFTGLQKYTNLNHSEHADTLRTLISNYKKA